MIINSRLGHQPGEIRIWDGIPRVNGANPVKERKERRSSQSGEKKRKGGKRSSQNWQEKALNFPKG